MPAQLIFQIQLVLGYVVWLLCFGAYIWPRLKAMDRAAAHRAIATLHSFRFFGLVFLLPGFVGDLPTRFAAGAAYGDFATALLAILALVAWRMRPLFWLFVVAFNLVGTVDLLAAYFNAIQGGLPPHAGDLRAAYVIPILYVPILLITHAVALYWLVRPQRRTVADVAGEAVRSRA